MSFKSFATAKKLDRLSPTSKYAGLMADDSVERNFKEINELRAAA